MPILSKRRIGGTMLLAVAFWAGRETFAWLLGKGLDLVSQGTGHMSFATFPWQNALATLLALVGGYLAFWPTKKAVVASPVQIGQGLGVAAGKIAFRLNLHTGIYRNVQAVRDPLVNVINDGISLLITFEKSGMAIVKLHTLNSDRQSLFAMLDYFTRMASLLRAGHIDEAKQAAPTIAEQAVADARTIQG